MKEKDNQMEVFQKMRDLQQAIQNNFFSLALVYFTCDGLEVRDKFTDDVVTVVWRPFDANDYGVASFNGTYRSDEMNNEFLEKAYQSVREYYFGK